MGTKNRPYNPVICRRVSDGRAASDMGDQYFDMAKNPLAEKCQSASAHDRARIRLTAA